MGIIVGPKTFKVLRGTIIIIAVVLVAYVAYGVSSLSVNNTGTVKLAPNWAGVTFSPPTTQPICSSQTYNPNTNPNPIAWGTSVSNNNAPVTAYLCVQNAGGAGASFTVTTSSLTPASGITVAYNGTATLSSLALANQAESLVVITVTAAATVPFNTAFSFTTNVA